MQSNKQEDDNIDALREQSDEIAEVIILLLEDEEYKEYDPAAICSALSWVLAHRAYTNGLSIGRATQGFRTAFEDVVEDMEQKFEDFVKETYSKAELKSLGFSTRTLNCLIAAGMFYVSDLLLRRDMELRCTNGIGVRTFIEIEEVLAKHSLAIRQ
jgi:hypothetical protein